MKKLILLALFSLLAFPVLADSPPDPEPMAVESEAPSEPAPAEAACGTEEVNLAPLAWDVDASAGGTTFNCGGRGCFECTMCCNAACGWLDPCNEACWQQHCSSTCP